MLSMAEILHVTFYLISVDDNINTFTIIYRPTSFNYRGLDIATS